jgi:hypothetical protein
MRYETTELVMHPQAYLYKVASNVASEWSMRARNRPPHDEQWVASLVDNEEPESQTMRAQSEHEIERHPSVATASVFGVPDDHWGEIVVAAVVPRGKNATVSDLIVKRSESVTTRI